jgi:hypothetical protein
MTALRLLDAGEQHCMDERVHALLERPFSLHEASKTDVLGKSFIQNCLDIRVVSLCCTARVLIHALHMFHQDVDEHAVFVAVQNNSNRMLAKNEMEI